MPEVYNHPLAAALPLSVALYVEEIKGRGGINDDDLTFANEAGLLLAEKGDILLFKSKKPGESATIFNTVAKAIAILSFFPGGIRLFGEHYESTG